MMITCGGFNMTDEDGEIIEKQNDGLIETCITIEKILNEVQLKINAVFEVIKVNLKRERDELEKMNIELRTYYEERDKKNQVYMK